MKYKATILFMDSNATCAATFEMEVCIPQCALEEWRTKIATLYSDMLGHVGKVVVKFENE